MTERIQTAPKRGDAQVFLDALPLAVGHADAEERITFTNRSYRATYTHGSEPRGRMIRSVVGEQIYAVVGPLIRRALAGEEVEFERSFVRLDGTTGVRSLRYVPDRDPAGAVVGFFALIEDITERKRAEATLRESEEKLRAIFEGALDGILVADTETRKFLTGNPTICRMLGYTLEEIVRIGVSDIHPEQDLPREIEKFERLLRGEIEMSVDVPVLRKDGSVFYADIKAASIRLGDKDGLLGIFRDVTERKRAEVRIARLVQIKDAMSRVNHTIVYAENEQPMFQEICATMVERAGFDYTGIGIADLETGEMRWVAGAGAGAEPLTRARRTVRADQPEGRGLTGTAFRERRHVVSQDFLADPSTAPWHEIGRTLGIGSAATFPIMRAGAAVGVINVYSRARQAFDDEVVALLDEAAQDVSFALENFDRERARRKAKSRASELLSIVNRSPAVFIKWRASNKRPVELVSDNIAEFGYAPDDFISGKVKYLDIVHPEDRARFIGERKRAEQEGQSVVLREYRVITLDGQVRWVEDRTWMQRDSVGRITHYQGLVQDITARKLAEAEQRAAEEQFRGLVEQSISGIYIIQDGRFAYVNPRIVEIFGYAAREELVGLEPAALVAESDRGLVAENIRRRMAGDVKSVAYTFTGLRKDGTTVGIGAHGTVATYRGRPAIIGVVQDITEKARAEEEIKRYVARLEQAMQSTIDVVATIGELRDPYTHGHERRVGEVAAAIAAEMGLDANRVEGIRIAGYVHDVGKIGVPAEILAKPTRLTTTEFELVKDHAQQSYEILKGVDFPWPVAQVALQHHERLDGSGYPRGLKGDAIILEARILAVADVIEAMASHRPYRAARGIEPALAEIEQGAGRVYDADVAKVALRLFRDKGYRLPE